MNCNTTAQDSALGYVTIDQLVALHIRFLGDLGEARDYLFLPDKGRLNKNLVQNKLTDELVLQYDRRGSKSTSPSTGMVRVQKCTNRLDGHAQLNHNPKHA